MDDIYAPGSLNKQLKFLTCLGKTRRMFTIGLGSTRGKGAPFPHIVPSWPQWVSSDLCPLLHEHRFRSVEEKGYGGRALLSLPPSNPTPSPCHALTALPPPQNASLHPDVPVHHSPRALGSGHYSSTQQWQHPCQALH